MGKQHQISLRKAFPAGSSPLQRVVNLVPLSILFTLAQAPGLSRCTLLQLETRLGAAMRYLAEREGHAPALAEQVRSGISAGMTPTQIAQCLDIEIHQVAIFASGETSLPEQD